ncbi:MAG: methyltransferase, CheR-type [Candidatus Brocadiaceae bacterium]|nr:methyltransferase, CheR-type [Candidatus Brocadiaceae bacterium]
MGNTISSDLLAQASVRMSMLMGLHFPKDRQADLERILCEAAPAFGFTDVVSFVEWLISFQLQKGHIERLADYFTVGETYFFREKASFDVLKEHVLPPIIRSKATNGRRLRIWCAGCCTGEEAYSIAILLTRIIADWKDWNISILATDINVNSLKKALSGKYTEWSFRNAPPWLKESYFEKKENGYYKILPSINQMVTFEQLNLAVDVYPSPFNSIYAMDMIFCRNVLMYFSPECAKKAVNGFYQTLTDNGLLIVSLTETIKLSGSSFVPIHFHGTTFYQKSPKGRIAEEGAKGKQVGGEIKVVRNTGENNFHALQLSTVDRATSGLRDTFYRDLTKSFEGKRYGTKVQRTPYEDALLLFEQGRYAEGEEIISGWTEHELNNPKALTLLARICANQGKLDDAEMWCEKAIIADKCCTVNYYLLATIVMEKDLIEEAVSLLKRALYLDPHFALVNFVLANILMRRGKHKAAKKYLDNAFNFISARNADEVVPESEGITVGRLMEIIAVMKRT